MTRKIGKIELSDVTELFAFMESNSKVLETLEASNRTTK